MCAPEPEQIIKLSYSLSLSRFLEGHPDLMCPMCSAPLMRDETRRLIDSAEVLLAWNAGSPESNDTNEASQATAAVTTAQTAADVSKLGALEFTETFNNSQHL